MEVRIASNNYVYYVTYVDDKDEVHERQMQGLFAVREIVDKIEKRSWYCLHVVRAGSFDEPVIIFSDGEWFPVKK